MRCRVGIVMMLLLEVRMPVPCSAARAADRQRQASRCPRIASVAHELVMPGTKRQVGGLQAGRGHLLMLQILVQLGLGAPRRRLPVELERHGDALVRPRGAVVVAAVKNAPFGPRRAPERQVQVLLAVVRRSRRLELLGVNAGIEVRDRILAVALDGSAIVRPGSFLLRVKQAQVDVLLAEELAHPGLPSAALVERDAPVLGAAPGEPRALPPEHVDELLLGQIAHLLNVVVIVQAKIDVGFHAAELDRRPIVGPSRGMSSVKSTCKKSSQAKPL